MRALIMDFNGDTAITDISDQYMFGEAIMVCPVYEYKARERDVYLPKQCDWYDFHTGEYLSGGQWIKTDAPLEDMPLYVRAGTILPFGPEIQYTGKTPELHSLYVSIREQMPGLHYMKTKGIITIMKKDISAIFPLTTTSIPGLLPLVPVKARFQRCPQKGYSI